MFFQKIIHPHASGGWMLFCGQFNRISRIGGTQNTVENWGEKDKIAE